MQRVVIKLALVVGMITIAGCDAVTRLSAPPGAVFQYVDHSNYGDPDDFQVDSINYPLFHVAQSFQPPPYRLPNGVPKRPMLEILPSDIWRVTHQINGRLLIYSESYQARETRFLSGRDNVTSGYLYHILLDRQGRVSGGWLILKNPKIIVRRDDRMIDLDFSKLPRDGWPDNPMFEPKM